MRNKKFTPYQGFGDIQFGEYYLDVRKKLNSLFEVVHFDKDTKTFCDHFDELGFKVEYDIENKVASIEAWGDPQHEFIFLEKNLIPLTFADAKAFLLSVDDKAEPFSIGLYSAKFGISVCADALEEDEPASSFCVVRSDYMTLKR